MAALTLLTGNGLHVQWPRSMWAPQFGPTPSKKTVTERDQTSVLPWTLQKDASASKTLARQAPEPSSLHDVIYRSFNVGVNKCWSTVSFCIVFKLRMVFIFFLMPSKKQKIKRIISCDRKSIWNSNFSMCKQSWWHRHACSLMWCLWLLQPQCNEKVQMQYIWSRKPKPLPALYRKSLPTPALIHPQISGKQFQIT